VDSGRAVAVARTAVSITKTLSFRGVAQEMSNTYYYQSVQGSLSEADGLALIDAIVALEKPMHSSAVTFVRGRAWSAGGTPAQNNMIAQKALSGNGTGPTDHSQLDRERAFLVRFRAGVDSKGRPVYLRKWWHLCIQSLNAETLSTGVLSNISQLSSGQRAQLVTWANQFKDVTANAVSYALVGPTGRPIDGATVAHPFLEHHQLGDQWRG
jgi:hypothetical protein